MKKKIAFKNSIFVKTIVLFLLFYPFGTAVSSNQKQVSDTNAKVVKYLNKIDVCCFSEVKPSVNDSSDLSVFNFHTTTYTINAPFEQVWNTCMFGSPTNLWQGKTLRLSGVYSEESDRLFSHDNQQPDSLELNQIYFISIRIMRLINLTAALKTTQIDHDENFIEFTYVDGNKAIGKQTVRLIAIDDNETKIVHDTFYKSNSKFRDKRLYPRFHQKAITDLHQKIDEYSAK
jgi:hypothetical protein